MRKLFWNNKAFSETCKFDHIKGGYFSGVTVGFVTDKSDTDSDATL